jgi:hypothetical protein
MSALLPSGQRAARFPPQSRIGEYATPTWQASASSCVSDTTTGSSGSEVRQVGSCTNRSSTAAPNSKPVRRFCRSGAGPNWRRELRTHSLVTAASGPGSADELHIRKLAIVVESGKDEPDTWDALSPPCAARNNGAEAANSTVWSKICNKEHAAADW